MSQAQISSEDVLTKQFLREESEYDNYIEEQMSEEIENAFLDDEPDKGNFKLKFFIIARKIIKSKNSKAYAVLICYLITAFRMFFDVSCYISGITNLRYDSVESNIFYYIAAIFIPFAVWLWSTSMEQYNYYFIKIASLIFCIINMITVLVNVVYLILCIFIVPICMCIPVSADISSNMIVSLAKSIVIIVPSVVAIVTFKSIVSDIMLRPMLSDILHYKIDRNIDTRKNKNYAYDYAVARKLSTGKIYSVKEDMRKQHMMIEGATGAGKTSMAFLPGIANDLDQRIKNENSQKRKVVAMLEQNQIVLSKNISDMEFDEKWFRATDKKSKKKFDNIFSSIVLCGLTIIAPNSSFGDEVYNLSVQRGITNINRIDPLLDEHGNHKPGYIGFNPFYINPKFTGLDLKMAIINRSRIFSDVLQALYESGGSSDVYFSSLNRQFTSSICTMIIKTMPMLHANNPEKYPHEQATPEDFQDIMNDFSLARPYYETLMLYLNEHPEEKNDYDNTLKLIARDILGPGAKTMLDQSRGLVILINELLANPLIRDVLCAEKSVDLDKAFAESQITLLNYELSLGDRDSRGFGLFFLLTMQSAVFRRPKNNRPIHFLYIDEFPVLLHPTLEKAFSLYRQYNVCMNVAIQAMSQFDKTNETKYMKNVLLSNASTQIIFGRAGVEEMELYEKLGGKVDRVIEQDTVNESSITEDNTSLTYSKRSSVQKESYIDGRDIRNRDFGEATMLTVDKGNPVDMFAVKLSFITSKQEKGKKTLKIDWSKYFDVEKADGTTSIYESADVPIVESSIIKNNISQNDYYEDTPLYNREYTIKQSNSSSTYISSKNNCDNDLYRENVHVIQDADSQIKTAEQIIYGNVNPSGEYLDDTPLFSNLITETKDNAGSANDIQNNNHNSAGKAESSQTEEILASVNELLENIGKININ